MSGKSKLDEGQYHELLKPMARELSAMARWVSQTNQRMIILFEGRDTAGKGGSIDMIARLLNPRRCRVVALPSPSERERSQWYFQRLEPCLIIAVEIADGDNARRRCRTVAEEGEGRTRGERDADQPAPAQVFCYQPPCPAVSHQRMRTATAVACDWMNGCSAMRAQTCFA